MHQAKRRRLDAANSTLAKPFRSPLRVDPSKRPNSSSEKLNHNDHTAQDPTAALPSAQTSPSSDSPTTQTASTTSSSPLRKATTSSPLKGIPTSLSSPVRPTRPIQFPRPPRPISDPTYIALQKQHSALSLQLKNITQSLDTATQALRYTTTLTSSDLPALITKWQSISRDCAEELFATAKDRVNKMGGVSAWREKYEKKVDNNESASWGFGNNSELPDEDDLTDEQKEQLEYMRDEAMREARKYGLDQPEEKEVRVERDDDTFTMDMMLKQLNVDLELIGYDKIAQRWAD